MRNGRKTLQNTGIRKGWLETMTLKGGAAAPVDGSYCLVGGFCSANTQFIGHKIGTYIVKYLNNFQKFNLMFNFILFCIRSKFTPFNNDEDHPLSRILFFYFSIWAGFLIFSSVGFLLSAGWLRNDAFSPVIGTLGSDDLLVSFIVSGFCILLFFLLPY